MENRGKTTSKKIKHCDSPRKRTIELEDLHQSRRVKSMGMTKGSNVIVIQDDKLRKESALAALLRVGEVVKRTEMDEDGRKAEWEYEVIASGRKKYLTPLSKRWLEEGEEDSSSDSQILNQQIASPLSTKEKVSVKDFEFDRVVDPNYKNNKNFAILRLSDHSAQYCSSPLVATPLHAEQLLTLSRRESASRDIAELLAKGYCLLPHTKNAEKLLNNSP